MRRKSAKSAKSRKSTKSATPDAKRMRLDRAFESSDDQRSRQLQDKRHKRAHNNGVKKFVYATSTTDTGFGNRGTSGKGNSRWEGNSNCRTSFS